MSVFFYIKLIIYVAKLIFMYYNIIIIDFRRLNYMKFQMWMDDDLYERFDSMCHELGLTPDSAVELLMSATIRENKLPFESEEALKFAIESRMDIKVKDYRREIDIALKQYPEEVQDELREKINNDIFDIYELHGIYTDEYFEMRLYDKDKSEWFDKYVSEADTGNIIDVLNKKAKDMLNKFTCYNMLKPYYKREAVCLTTMEDKYDVLFFIKQHDKVVMKPIHDSNTDNIRIFRYCDIRDLDKFADTILEKYDGGVIIEEYIEQDDEFASFNAKSVNTVRVSVLKTLDGKCHTHKIFQIGKKHSCVDDVKKGAYRCALDKQTGVITAVYGINGVKYDENTTKGSAYVGKSIDLSNLDNIVEQMMNELPGQNYIEFDFAKSHGEWVLVDVNVRPDITGIQTTLNRGIRKELSDVLTSYDKFAKL